ncbi:hypothetical protein [Gaiella sp.]|jgi:hypothetical protein|uniref:hypothetical protein n=1 Tax=Gaiella sp. TaxID=2663207 RepID=UPI002E303DE5|nr:hypothetical protein [Gaiella sp.]HEX5582401.1 hypothetical protein [Gaiella sp.]
MGRVPSLTHDALRGRTSVHGLGHVDFARHALTIVVAVLVASVVVTAAVASSAYRTYFAPYGAYVAGGGDRTDGLNHNHDWHASDWTNSDKPKRIYELTPNTQEVHYQMDSNGQHLVYPHYPGYYAAPHCKNMSGVTLWSQGCTAGW